jgi:hypothetical protein
MLVQEYEGDGVSETCSNIGGGFTFIFMFKGCGVKCRCVTTKSAYRVLFYVISCSRRFMLQAALYDTGLE